MYHFSSELMLLRTEPSLTMKDGQAFFPTVSDGRVWLPSAWSSQGLAEQAVFMTECLTQLGLGQNHMHGNRVAAEL